VKPTRILWLSRHRPKPEQLRELVDCFGEVEIVAVFEKISSGQQVVNMIRQHQCTEVIVVLPEKLLKEVVDAGVQPIRAKMAREFLSNGNVRFNHLYFERVIDVCITTKKISSGGKKDGQKTLP